MDLVIRWSEPGVFIQACRALFTRHGEDGIPALPTAVGAIPICRPECHHPRTGVRELVVLLIISAETVIRREMLTGGGDVRTCPSLCFESGRDEVSSGESDDG